METTIEVVNEYGFGSGMPCRLVRSDGKKSKVYESTAHALADLDYGQPEFK
jgi:hypothetical protein